MKPRPRPHLHELRAGNEEFLCAQLPEADGPIPAHVMSALSGGDGEAPAFLYWDGRLVGAESNGRLHFGRGGLDPILASEIDLSNCIAINRTAFERLLSHKAIRSEEEFSRAAALLARSPSAKGLWCAGLTGAVDPAAKGPFSHAHGPAARAESVSLAVIAPGPEHSIEPFFAALKGQQIDGPVDVVLVSLGLQSDGLKALAAAAERAGAADPRVKIRRYAVSGPIEGAYLANLAVAHASGDAVVIADVRCIPVTPNAIQRLADWSMSSDTSTACPRILLEGELLSAGLALAREQESEAVLPWRDETASQLIRMAAAPAPWLFAVRRNAWLAAGGLRGGGGQLWTAEFAFARGPKGRNLLIGSETAEWIGSTSPIAEGLSTPAHDRLQSMASTAVRDPSPAPPARRVVRQTAAGGQPGFTDRFPSSAETRLLVFADGFGASQAIPFVEGLANARCQGRIAVRIVEEAAFDGDSRALEDGDATPLVAHHIDATKPTVIAVSRLGHAAIWKAVEEAATRLDIPILCHLDDDVLDLPVILGLERYRLARNPRRVRTLLRSIRRADLIVTTTPALTDRLRLDAGHDRIVTLNAGAAGCAPSRPPVRERAEVRIGYMGSASHNHDLSLVAPALNRISARYPSVRIVLFGSIAEQPAARDIEKVAERHRPVGGGYAEFRDRMRALDMDIGLAPLASNAFNRAKTPTKWVEYTEAGAAVIASPLSPYLPMIEAGAALPAGTDGWELGLRRLIEYPSLRRQLVDRAAALLSERFTWSHLEGEVLSILDRVAEKRSVA